MEEEETVTTNELRNNKPEEVEQDTQRPEALKERWRIICEDYRCSGSTAVSYSSSHGISVHRLKYWLKKFSRERVAGGSFVELRLPPKPEQTKYKVSLNNGNSVEVSGNFQVVRIKELLESLR